MYTSGMVGLGDSGPSGPSYSIGGSNAQGILHSSGKTGNSFNSGSNGPGSSQTQYRGYSPSKPKWKANTIGMPQQNNLVGSGMSHHNQMISHVQGFSATSTSGTMALRSKNKH